MDDNFEWSRATLAISIDGDLITCVVTDGSIVEPLAVRDGDQVATLLRASRPGTDTDDDGVTAVTAATAPARPRSEFDVDVFPRFTEDASPGDRGQFAIQATRLFEDLKQDVDTALSELVDNNADITRQTTSVDTLVNRIVVSIPGIYDDRDIDDVKTALDAAGFDVDTIVRAPVGSALNHLQSTTAPLTAVVVELGAYWCNAAVIVLDPDIPSIDVRARVVTPDLGRRAMDRALAEWAIKSEQNERNITITPRSSAFERIQAAAHDVLESGRPGDVLSVRDIHDVELSDGQPPIEIEQPVDSTLAAFEPINQDLCDTFDRLLTMGDVDRSDIDDVIVAGSGSIPLGIDEIIEGYWERPIARPADDANPRSVPAIGASTLVHRDSGEAGITSIDMNETVAGSIELSVPTSKDVVTKTVVKASSPVGSTHRVRVRTTTDNQLRGQFQLLSKHQVTGERRLVGSYIIKPLPTGEAAGEVVFEILLTPTANPTEQEAVDIEAQFPDELLDEQISEDPTVTSVSDGVDAAPWLVPADIDLDEMDVAAVDTGRDVVVDDPLAQSLDDTSPKAVLETILNVRYQIWKATQAEDPLDPEDLEKLLELFDMGLAKINVDIIAPEPGDERDRQQHRVWDTTPAASPNGEIVKIHKPGFRIDGHVDTPADVIVSKGEPSDSAAVDADSSNDSDSGDESGDDTNLGAEDSDAPSSHRTETTGTDEAEIDDGAVDDADAEGRLSVDESTEERTGMRRTERPTGDGVPPSDTDDERSTAADSTTEHGAHTASSTETDSESQQSTETSVSDMQQLRITAAPSNPSVEEPVEFTVTNETGDPIADAQIKYKNSVKTTTNDQGTAELKFNNEGEWTITAAKSHPEDGWQYQEGSVTIICSE